MKRIIARWTLGLALLLAAFAGVPPAQAAQNATSCPTTGTLSGLALVQCINNAFATSVSNFSGASAPGTPTTYQLWADTTTNILKIYNGTVWMPVGSFSGSQWTPISNGVKAGAIASTGSSNAFVLTLSPAPTALVSGQVYTFIANFTITGSATLNINSLGAKNLTKNGVSALVASDIVSGQVVAVVYDGTGFQMVSPTAAAVLTNPWVPVRQTALASPVDSNGVPTFLPSTAGALSLTSQNITGSAPLVVTAANGFGSSGQVDRVGQTTSNLTWSSLAASTTNYLYVDIAANGTLTTGSTTLQPAYQQGGAFSTTNGQFTFNVQQMSGQVGNGSTAAQAYRVFVGEAVTSGSAVTSTIAYALMARYMAPFTNTLPGAATQTIFNHNIGVADLELTAEFRNINAEGGFSPGEITANALISPASGQSAPLPLNYARTRCWFTSGANAAFNFINSGTGTVLIPTAANWAYRMTAQRRW